MLHGVTIRLLAPANPITFGWPVTVRARTNLPAERISWDWDDGTDEIHVAPPLGVHLRATHLYRMPGVYRVQIRPLDAGSNGGDTRFVAVRRKGEIAGSGWLCDARSRRRMPFGFLITSAGPSGVERVAFRCLMAEDELSDIQQEWMFRGSPGALHFGGSASLGGRPGRFHFRVDLRSATNRRDQQLTISAYAPGSRPGTDSPAHRLSGKIWPGRVILLETRPLG